MPNKKKMMKNFRQEIDAVNTLTLDKNTVKTLRAKALDILEDTNSAGRAIVFYIEQVERLAK